MASGDDVARAGVESSTPGMRRCGSGMKWMPLALAAWTPWAFAASPSTSFQVSAVVEAGCYVDGTGTGGDAGNLGQLDFGRDSALSVAAHTADLSASQVITLRCTPGVALMMRIGGGQHLAAGVRNLQLGSTTSQRVAYGLYRDAGFTQPIGIDQDQGIAVTVANTNDIRLPVRGRLVLPGNRAVGVYTDVLLVTLDW